jgi:hypothetical protein
MEDDRPQGSIRSAPLYTRNTPVGYEKYAGQAAKVDRAECGRSGASASAKREIFRAKMRYAEWGCFGGGSKPGRFGCGKIWIDTRDR